MHLRDQNESTGLISDTIVGNTFESKGAFFLDVLKGAHKMLRVIIQLQDVGWPSFFPNFYT